MSSQGENQSNPTEEIKSVANTHTQKKSGNFIVVFGSLIAVVVVLAITGILVFRASLSDKGQSTQNDAAGKRLPPAQEASSTTSRAYIPTSEKKPEEVTQKDRDIEAKRQALEKYQLSENKFDPSELNFVSFDTAQVEKLKQQVKDDASSLKTEPGKKVKMTISYSSIGDEDFREGTLYIKLSEGLKLVPGSMEDLFDTQGLIKVQDSLFNEKNSLIMYGPGSGDKQASKVSVGQQGIFSFVVEITDSSAKNLAISSYMQDRDGKLGKPSLFFIET